MSYLAPLIGEMFMDMYNSTRDIEYNPNDKGKFLFDAFVKYCDKCLDAGIRNKIEADKARYEEEERKKKELEESDYLSLENLLTNEDGSISQAGYGVAGVAVLAALMIGTKQKSKK